MSFFDTLENILKQDERLIADDGSIIKSKAYDLGVVGDSRILKLLIDNSDTKAHFFKDIDGVLVFDSIKFGWIITSKEFLPNSYTKYKNKIGLIDNAGRNIAQNKDVCLVWPYKDCVLEGGQTREEQKRDEIFYNEILSPDEINRLLYPKVFTNAKRYTSVGEEKITSIADHDNLIIRGNNLLVLPSILKKYENKVKLIYLDPPYNTGSDGFYYNDNFTYSSWLVFMKNRLELAKRLLTKDGLIFISIDISRDNANGRVGTTAFPYLNVLMDEIFGRQNYIATLMWKKKKQPSFLSRVAGIIEPILVYAKDEKNIGKLQRGEQNDTTKRIDNASNKCSTMRIEAGIRYMGLNRDCIIPKGKYQNKTMTTEFLQEVRIVDGRTINAFEAIAKYRNSQEEITKFCNQDLMYITANNSFRRYKTAEEESSGKTITDLLLDWGQNQDATDELRKLFDITNDEKAFDNPKPEQLLANIIEVSTEPGDIVLDFFLGSGTTAAVAHKMDRQYIGIDQMDYIENLAVERLKKVIKGEPGGVSKTLEWQGGGSFVYCELKQLNEFYMEKALSATSNEEIQLLVEEILKTGFISQRVNPVDIDVSAKDFIDLTLENKRQLLLEIINKNLLYVNLCDIDDAEFGVSEDEKAFTNSFYRRD